jgi:hypothetical protein
MIFAMNMTRLYLTSYATERFRCVQQDLNASAIKFGIPNILSYNESDLHASEFYLQNKTLLDEVCGAGYWAWKPYFILRAMEHLLEGDILFYCDAGSMFINSPAPLIDICMGHPQGMILFDARPLTNRQFTKRDCFVRMNCDEEKYWNANKVIATILVLRKCPYALGVIREWLTYCCDRAMITDDPNTCGLEDLTGYLQHRWDQAILSVLAAKHSIETFRLPMFWGNYLKLPQFRVPGEHVASPWHMVPEITGYSRKPQENSPYGTLFITNRLPNMVGKKPLLMPIKSRQASFPRRCLSWVRRHLTLTA